MFAPKKKVPGTRVLAGTSTFPAKKNVPTAPVPKAAAKPDVENAADAKKPGDAKEDAAPQGNPALAKLAALSLLQKKQPLKK